jgi:hypothetical protein
MSRVFASCLILLFLKPLAAADLKSAAVQEWNRYLQWANATVLKEEADPQIFLIQNSLPPSERAEVKRQIETGGIYVSRRAGVIPKGAHFNIPDAEIHHWWGSILLKNVKLPQLLEFLKDYNHHAGKFAEVERSRLLSVNDGNYRVYFRFRRSKSFVTVVYNTEQDCVYENRGAGRVISNSVATKIAEVEDPGTQSEREKPIGHDSGYLWRLVSWWRYEQRGDDVVVELESASLSRDIPFIVNLVPGLSHYIRSTPRESLESVLTSIRQYARQP